MNALRDHLRRRKREVLLPDELAPTADQADGEPTRDAPLRRALNEALFELPLEQRQVVILHQLEGFSFAEIAEIAGCTRSAAKVRAHRGYLRLREILGDTYAELRR